MTSITGFSDLPNKAQHLIFEHLSQIERQKIRLACNTWKTLINEEFPVELVITQSNYERLFRCTNAVTAEIQSITTEYNGTVGFGSSIRSIQFTGKVLSSNVLNILRCCPNLDILRFSSLKQVLGIEEKETIKLPNTTILEIKVRPDQETFTSDEIIIISTLRQILFGSLKTILISTGNMMENWDDESTYNENDSQVFSTDTKSFTVHASNLSFDRNSALSSDDASLNLASSFVSGVEEGEPGPNSFESEQVPELIVAGEPYGEETDTIENHNTSPEQHTQTDNEHVQVIVDRTSGFTRGTNSAREGVSISSDAATSTSNESSNVSNASNSSRRVRYNLSEFEARLFYANLEILTENTRENSALEIFLNDSMSQTGHQMDRYYELLGVTKPPDFKHSVFFELVRNNHSTLKNLYVKTRPDFMCFGNLSGFGSDVLQVQFDEVEYSFGRTQICCEQILLRAQKHLTKIRIHIIDDMWKHLMLAVENCQNTLVELDVKVLSVNEDRVDIIPITKCSKLKSLKLLHFFEKESICLLPKSLNKLILNGPVSYKDMMEWTKVLVELEDLTLILNVRGDKIDLSLYKRFLKMPKLSKLTFIQCPMDLNIIKQYASQITTTNGFRFWINGPKELGEVPGVQYVYTLIMPNEFKKEQIDIDEPLLINQI